MKKFFITGTDTDVGKTIVSCAIASAAHYRGFKTGVMKPFASGSLEDTRLLKLHAHSKQTLAEITPFYFKHPLAPYSSTLFEKKTVSIKKLQHVAHQMMATHDVSIFEGVGGALVPITASYRAIDIAQTLHLSIIVVARLSLGTINHTLLTLEAIRSRGLLLEGVIFNQIPEGKQGLAEKTNALVVQRLGKVKILGIFPYIQHKSLASPRLLSKYAEKHIEVDALLC